jgi:hypothetical protein
MNNDLNWGGWIIMIVSVGGTTAFLGWCIYKVCLAPEASERLHGQVDIETPDTRDDSR